MQHGVMIKGCSGSVKHKELTIKITPGRIDKRTPESADPLTTIRAHPVVITLHDCSFGVSKDERKQVSDKKNKKNTNKHKSTQNTKN